MSETHNIGLAVKWQCIALDAAGIDDDVCLEQGEQN